MKENMTAANLLIHLYLYLSMILGLFSNKEPEIELERHIYLSKFIHLSFHISKKPSIQVITENLKENMPTDSVIHLVTIRSRKITSILSPQARVADHVELKPG